MSSTAIQYLISHLCETEDEDRPSESSSNEINHQISTAVSHLQQHRNAEALAVLLHLLPRVPPGKRFKAIRSLIYRLQDDERRGERDLDPWNTLRKEANFVERNEVFMRKSGLKDLNTQKPRGNKQPTANNKEAVVCLLERKSRKCTTYLCKLASPSIQV